MLMARCWWARARPQAWTSWRGPRTTRTGAASSSTWRPTGGRRPARRPLPGPSTYGTRSGYGNGSSSASF